MRQVDCSDSSRLENPDTSDNRAYNYSNHPVVARAEHSVIVDWVPSGARVLDLGCGNGTLLARLRDERHASGEGVEITDTGVQQCVAKGLNVRRGRIDVKLDWPDDAFDVAICSATIQMVLYPEMLLREMRRLAPTAIVSFANFAFIKNRLDYLLCGRMPRPMLFGYKWYNTGHIHQLSLLDFLSLCTELGLAVQESHFRGHTNMLIDRVFRAFPNVFTSLPLLKMTRS